MNISKIIETKINNAQYGTVFIVSDFIDIASYDTVRKILSRLSNKNIIKKIIRGMYYKPKFSSLLNEYVEPNINLVASAIARNYGWTIVPSSETSLNLLGISTQVTSHYEFISSGPYRKYCINGIAISFLHRVDKDFAGMSYKTKLLTQAIKAIGKEKINDYIYIISNRLTEEDKQVALEEAKRTTAWVYEVIKELQKEKN